MKDIRNKTWLNKHGNTMGRVFEIVNGVTGDTYIGHTTTPVNKRLYQAISSANSGRKGLLFDSIRKYGKEVFKINILHECNYDEDVLIKEKEFIRKLSPTLNADKGVQEVIFELLNVVTGDNYIGSTSYTLDKKLLQMFIAAKAGKEGMIYDDIRAWGEECYDIKFIQEATSEQDTLRIIYECNPSLNENKDEWLFL